MTGSLTELPSTATAHMRSVYEHALQHEPGEARYLLGIAIEEDDKIRTAWQTASERKRWINGNIVTLGIGVAICFASYAYFFFAEQEDNIYANGISVATSDFAIAAIIKVTTFIVPIVAILGVGVAFTRHRTLFRANAARFRIEQQRKGLSEAIDSGDASKSKEVGGQLDLRGVWNVTQKRLDFYHSLATEQADKSFRDNRLATASGFTVLVAATVLAGVASSLSGAIAAGVIAAIGGALTAYLSKTFMRTHERASVQLHSYFGQPLAVSRYLAAERLLSELDGEAKSEAVRDIIKFIAATPDAPSAEQADEIGSDIQKSTR